MWSLRPQPQSKFTMLRVGQREIIDMLFYGISDNKFQLI